LSHLVKEARDSRRRLCVMKKAMNNPRILSSMSAVGQIATQTKLRVAPVMSAVPRESGQVVSSSLNDAMGQQDV
jgi:hypothetical protein